MGNRCPACKQPAPREQNEAYPFCSSRCRLVDLSKWLDGEYRVAGEPTYDPPTGSEHD